LGIALFWVLVAVCLYSTGLDGAYFSDDYLFAAARPVANPLRHFLDASLLSGWYRPIEAAILTSIQSAWQLDPRPVHALALFFHTVMIVLVIGAMRGQGGSRVAIAAAGGVMAISQANAMAVLSIDALSQLMSTLAGFGAVLVAGRAAAGQTFGRRVMTAILLLLALFSKESGLAFLPAAVGMIALRRDVPSGTGNRDKLWDIVALLAVTALFFWMRGRTDAPSLSFGDLRYQLRIGANIPTNFGLLALAVLLPGSNVWFVDAYRAGHSTTVALMIAGAVALAAWTVLGIGFSPRRRRGLAWLGCAALVVGPLLPLNHVSELYAYAAMPMLALAFGIAAEGWQDRARGRPAWVLFLIVLAVSHGAAIVDKARMMKRNGTEATRLMAQVEPWVARVPEHGELWLVQPDSLAPRYSVYRLNGFRPIEYSEQWLRDRHDRPDMQFEIVTESEARRHPANAQTVVLEWRDGQVVERTW
jgi:hypothetical protein